MPKVNFHCLGFSIYIKRVGLKTVLHTHRLIARWMKLIGTFVDVIYLREVSLLKKSKTSLVILSPRNLHTVEKKKKKKNN